MLRNFCFAADVWDRIFRWCGWPIFLTDFIREGFDCYSVMNGSKVIKETMTIVLMASAHLLGRKWVDF